MSRVFLASRNTKKILEMQRILAEHVPDVEVLGIADDSGLCVDALNGMPGVLSARWAGQRLGDKELADARNNELLLAQLRDVPDERRGAHFACAVAWVRPDGSERVVEGRMDGRIIREQRGSGGFGYDVVFVAKEHDAEGLTSAELEPGEKDRISHRGRALRELAPYVAADLTSGVRSAD